MTVKAEHWVNVNGKWYSAGQYYETEAEVHEETPLQPQTEPKAEETQPKRGRKRKAE